MFWFREARKKALFRKKELFEATCLPKAKPADGARLWGNLKWELYELENEEMITKQEQMAQEKIRKGLHKPQKKKEQEKQ